MMRLVLPLLLLMFCAFAEAAPSSTQAEDSPPLDYPSWADDLDRAKLEAFHGHYDKSLQTLASVRDADAVQIALVRATSLAATGRRQQAIDVLSNPAVADDPRAQIRRTVVLIELGRHRDAIALLSRHPQSIAARYWLGQAHEQIGDLESARQAYGWFVTEPQDFLAKWQKHAEKAFDNAEDVTIIGRAIDRWATLTGSYQQLPQLHDALLDMFVRAYDVIDRSYWPARVASAEYFLSHDNSKQAADELQAVLRANPNDVRTHELLGLIALEKFDFDAADRATASIRRVDPDSVRADLLEARNLLLQRRPGEASAPIQRVLAKQPEHLEALGLLAAMFALRLQDDRAAEVLSHVEKVDPDNATAHFEVAEQLAAMRQYPRAIANYKIAIERAPWWTEARNGLGLIYTQSGDEDEARATLQAAHALDPFNLRTTNYLRLLDDLDKFAREETAHFVVLYDARTDSVIAEYFAEYLESIHGELTKKYACEPTGKTYIEVFPTHDAFSVRTTGTPWIGTVGASTGRVIALVAPRKGEGTLGPFNWANVLRHEYTHTVTLAATDNRIPHWMTEGLAVLEERSPMKWEWAPMLYEAVSGDRLFTLDGLTWGFVRPRRPGDRALAYAQSFWICQYIEQTYGHGAILKMLAEFRAGGSVEAVLPKVLQRSTERFQSDFVSWARQQVAGWGYDAATAAKYDALRERGEGLIRSRQYDKAVELWQQIASIRPVDELPHQRLAGLYLTPQINQPAKAIEHLKVLHAVELKDNRYAKRIARLYRDLNQPSLARDFALQSVYIDPYDLDAHKLLLDAADAMNDEATASRQRRVIAILERK